MATASKERTLGVPQEDFSVTRLPRVSQLFENYGMVGKAVFQTLCPHGLEERVRSETIFAAELQEKERERILSELRLLDSMDIWEVWKIKEYFEKLLATNPEDLAAMWKLRPIVNFQCRKDGHTTEDLTKFMKWNVSKTAFLGEGRSRQDREEALKILLCQDCHKFLETLPRLVLIHTLWAFYPYEDEKTCKLIQARINEACQPRVER